MWGAENFLNPNNIIQRMEAIIEAAGLTKTEAKVYVTLLELGEAKTGEILKKANINSGRIYEILNSLENKGLVSSIIKKKVKLFIPSPPDRIKDYMDTKIKDLEKKKLSFENILPSLREKYNAIKEKIDIEVFYGPQGQRTAYSIFFKEGEKHKKLYVYGIIKQEKYPKEILDILSYYVYKKRKELKLTTYKIMSSDVKNEKIFHQDKAVIRYLPYTSMTSIQMLGEATLITHEQEPIITILIKSRKIAEDYKEQFNLLWKQAKRE
jgi:sugar-specific transcriptional regulator TrmB